VLPTLLGFEPFDAFVAFVVAPFGLLTSQAFAVPGCLTLTCGELRQCSLWRSVCSVPWRRDGACRRLCASISGSEGRGSRSGRELPARIGGSCRRDCRRALP
jgi:hypothetical protein